MTTQKGGPFFVSHESDNQEAADRLVILPLSCLPTDLFNRRSGEITDSPNRCQAHEHQNSFLLDSYASGKDKNAKVIDQINPCEVSNSATGREQMLNRGGILRLLSRLHKKMHTDDRKVADT